MGEDIIMKISKEFVMREIAGEYVIVPTGKTVLDFNGLITVNEVGASIWKILQEETNKKEIVEKLLEEYEVDEETAAKDVDDFIDKLVQGKILSEEDIK